MLYQERTVEAHLFEATYVINESCPPWQKNIKKKTKKKQPYTFMLVMVLILQPDSTDV